MENGSHLPEDLIAQPEPGEEGNLPARKSVLGVQPFAWPDVSLQDPHPYVTTLSPPVLSQFQKVQKLLPHQPHRPFQWHGLRIAHLSMGER